MAKLPEREYFLVFTLITVLAILIGGFYAAWTMMSEPERLPEVAYTNFDPIVVSSQTYSIKTSISVQTASKDETWIKENKASLENVFKNWLANTDPKIVRGANGLQLLQDSLKDESNKALKTTAIQNVLLTDFVLVMEDSQ